MSKKSTKIAQTDSEEIVLGFNKADFERFLERVVMNRLMDKADELTPEEIKEQIAMVFDAYMQYSDAKWREFVDNAKSLLRRENA